MIQINKKVKEVNKKKKNQKIKINIKIMLTLILYLQLITVKDKSLQKNRDFFLIILKAGKISCNLLKKEINIKFKILKVIYK